jgi:hypothetical protein
LAEQFRRPLTATRLLTIVMAGLVPAIRVVSDAREDVDARDERGHDKRGARPAAPIPRQDGFQP